MTRLCIMIAVDKRSREPFKFGISRPTLCIGESSTGLDDRMAVERRRSFHQIGGTIQELLTNFDTAGYFELVRLMRWWPEVVGGTIARRTEVSSLKFHTAVIKVSGAMWIQELNLMKPQILSRLRTSMRNDAVREIRFVQGKLSRRERSHLRVIQRRARRTMELPELKDPELQRAFEDLIEAWGRSPR